MLSKTDETYLKRYEPALQKPKCVFIFSYGLAWALITGVLTTLLDDAMGRESFTMRHFLVALVFWPIAGIVFGWWMRRVVQKKVFSIQQKLTETGS